MQKQFDQGNIKGINVEDPGLDVRVIIKESCRKNAE